MRDCPVSVVRLERCIGGAAARNLGLSRSSSNFVAFLDDDDEWLPEKMARQIAYFEDHPDAVLVSCGYYRVEGGMEYEEGCSEDFVRRYCEYDNFWGSFSFFVINRAALTEQALLDPKLPALQDWDFALRVTRANAFGIVEQPLVRYHAHDLPRITTKRVNHVRGLRRFYLQHRPYLSDDARRWLLSRMLFERSYALSYGRAKRRLVFASVRLGMRTQLPLAVRLRSMARRLGSLVFQQRTLTKVRCACIGLWQGLRSRVLSFSRLVRNANK